MTNGQAVCYLLAIVLLFVAAFGFRTKRVNLVVLAAALALLGYALPGITHLVHVLTG